jgi:hypothetical protein
MVSQFRLFFPIIYVERYLIHDYDEIVISDSVQSVCYGDDCTFRKPLLDHFLDELIRLQINVGGGLVKNDYFVVLEHHSSQTHQLFLTHAEDTGGYGHICLQGVLKLVDLIQ